MEGGDNPSGAIFERMDLKLHCNTLGVLRKETGVRRHRKQSEGRPGFSSWGGRRGRQGRYGRTHSPESGKKQGGRGHLPGSERRRGAGQGTLHRPEVCPWSGSHSQSWGRVTLLSLVQGSSPRGAAEAAATGPEPRAPGPPLCSPHGCRGGLDSPGEARTLLLQLRNGLSVAAETVL